jgi:hypothetical protein
MATSSTALQDRQIWWEGCEVVLLVLGIPVSCASALLLVGMSGVSAPACLIIAYMTFVIGFLLKKILVTPFITAKVPAADTSAVDALKARLLGLVDGRDAALAEIAESNEPEEVKEEKMRAVLEQYRRDADAA